MVVFIYGSICSHMLPLTKKGESSATIVSPPQSVVNTELKSVCAKCSRTVTSSESDGSNRSPRAHIRQELVKDCGSVKSIKHVKSSARVCEAFSDDVNMRLEGALIGSKYHVAARSLEPSANM